MLKLLYPQLWSGCVGAWCPSVDRSRSTLLTDHSGRGNHGTLTNMDPGTDWVASGGKIALDLDGTNDYVSIPLSKTQIGTTPTFSMWLRSTNSSPGTNTGIFSVANTSVDGDPWILVQNNTATTIRNYLAGAYRETTIVVGEWFHYAFNFDGTNCRVYKNGIIDGTYAGGFLANTASTTFLGSAFNGKLQGQIDDVRIYSRALTPNEIAILAQRRGVAYETYSVPTVRGATVGTTFTATMALVAGGATFSASGTTVVPTYTGALVAMAGSVEFSASGTTTVPTYAATLAALVGGAQFASLGTTIVPSYTATLAATSGGASFSGIGSTVVPTYAATLSMSAGGTTFAGVGSTTGAVTAIATLTTGGALFAASGTTVVPTFTATTSMAVGGTTFAGVASFSETLVYTATLGMLAGGAVFAGTATHAAPMYTAMLGMLCGGVQFAGAEVVAPSTIKMLNWQNVLIAY